PIPPIKLYLQLDLDPAPTFQTASPSSSHNAFDTIVNTALTCNPVDPTGKNSKQIAVAIIPARYGSSRLPGKPLLEIAGKPLILWVIEQALGAGTVARAIAATDDARIFDTVTAAGFEAI